MRKEIIKWYASKHFHLHKMIKIGRRHGLNRTQIEAAMVHCWSKIQNGKPIQDIDVARYVFNVAKDVDDTPYSKRLEILADLEDENSELKAMLYCYCGTFCLIGFFLLTWSLI